MRISIRKTIALVLVLAYVTFTGYAMINNMTVPTEFVTSVGLVIGLYFSKQRIGDDK